MTQLGVILGLMAGFTQPVFASSGNESSRFEWLDAAFCAQQFTGSMPERGWLLALIVKKPSIVSTEAELGEIARFMKVSRLTRVDVPLTEQTSFNEWLVQFRRALELGEADSSATGTLPGLLEGKTSQFGSDQIVEQLQAGSHRYFVVIESTTRSSSDLLMVQTFVGMLMEGTDTVRFAIHLKNDQFDSDPPGSD